MAFTEEDAENDGLIKREVGKSLNSVMSRQGGELYRKFLDWCDEHDLDPSNQLGEMALRAIQDDGYAQKIAQTTVNPEKLNTDSTRQEDLELVVGLIDEYADDDGDSSFGAIDRLIEKRIEAIGNGPLMQVAEDQQRKKDSASKDEKIRDLEREIERLKRSENNATQQQSEPQSEPEPAGKNVEEIDDEIDSLFDEPEEQEETGDGEPESQSQSEGGVDDADFTTSTADTGGMDSGPPDLGGDDDSSADIAGNESGEETDDVTEVDEDE